MLKAFTVFPTYNRQLAESDSEAISPELFAEFIAYLLEIQEEPRLRKVAPQPKNLSPNPKTPTPTQPPNPPT